GIEEQAGLIYWHVGVWHDLGYADPPTPSCKPVPPLGERSPAAIEGAHKAIEEIGQLTRRLRGLREQLEGELRQDGEARHRSPGRDLTAAGTPRAYAEMHRVLCAHAGDNGQGAHWLAPGETCTASTPAGGAR
ncbi:MAG TPA: hypothetical protein VMV92_10275, partial [Streptosporangiaceae bacterium]|nr:hypothetical protein [Streptosporangiaceae bacterium]